MKWIQTNFTYASSPGSDGSGVAAVAWNNTNEIADGYHTFGELYEHRIILFIALCRAYSEDVTEYKSVPVWRSKLHSDGTIFDGWFIMGINKEKGKQIEKKRERERERYRERQRDRESDIERERGRYV